MGNVTGSLAYVGGLAGNNIQIISNCYFSGNVSGPSGIGGLMGNSQTFLEVSNSHYNIDNVLINGGNHITLGGLFDAQYRDWYSRGLSLNISDYSTSFVPFGGHFNISSVQGFRDLLGFADGGYSFRLVSDIDLSSAPGLYIPYLKGEFDGDNHTISNLDIVRYFSSLEAMFGLNEGGTVKNIGLVDVNVYCDYGNAGLVGRNEGTVSNSYATGNVTGDKPIGGLVGDNRGIVNNSYAMVNVTGTTFVGGLVGLNRYGNVYNSYSTGLVTGDFFPGGFVARNGGTVFNCFWDMETSGQSSSDGGEGKTTAEMKTRFTFTLSLIHI